MPVVTGIDILGIQEYVFASNRLRDVVAASWVVDHALKRQADSLLQWGVKDENVLLAASGNAIVEFGDINDARKWTHCYTRWLHAEAPGLEVVVAHRQYDKGSLAWGLKALAVDLARAKLERKPNAPQLGLSVTAACSVTGLPATSLDPHDHLPLSLRIESLRRDDVQTRAKERWDSYRPERLEHASEWRAEFPSELDLMGRSPGETSLIGIVHIDGNEVGKRINGWLDRCFSERIDDDRVRNEYREWSVAIDKLGETVLRGVVGRVASCIIEEEDGHGKKQCVVRGTPHELGFRLQDWRDDKTQKGAKNTVFLPLRPILFGGDDLTFVCDGRIALDLAAAALRAFEGYCIPHLGKDGGETTLSACAGVALVRAHAPFHIGYALAENLCRSAKRCRQSTYESRGIETGCWLDWHVGSKRPTETIDALRKREYQGGNLTMRPYPLVEVDRRKQSWTWLDTELLGPGNRPDTAERGLRGATCWSGSRSRVKQLATLVRGGPDAVRRQIAAWNAIEAGVQLPGELPPGGFIDRETPLLDAIELLDLHLRLEPDPVAAEHTAPASTAKEATR